MNFQEIKYVKFFGLREPFSHEELKSAYKTAAKKFHPDLNPENPKASENFKIVTIAFESLKKYTVVKKNRNSLKFNSKNKLYRHVSGKNKILIPKEFLERGCTIFCIEGSSEFILNVPINATEGMVATIKLFNEFTNKTEERKYILIEGHDPL